MQSDAGVSFLSDGVSDPSRRPQERREQRRFRPSRAAQFHDLRNFPRLETVRHLKPLSCRRHLPKGQDDRLFLCEMQDGALPPELQIARKNAQTMVERDREPSPVARSVEVKIRIHEYGQEKEQRPEDKRV